MHFLFFFTLLFDNIAFNSIISKNSSNKFQKCCTIYSQISKNIGAKLLRLLLLRYTFGGYQSLPYPLHLLISKNTVVSTVLQYKAVFCNAFILHRIHNKAFSPLLQQNVNEGSKWHSALKSEQSAILGCLKGFDI